MLSLRSSSAMQETTGDRRGRAAINSRASGLVQYKLGTDEDYARFRIERIVKVALNR